MAGQHYIRRFLRRWQLHPQCNGYMVRLAVVPLPSPVDQLLHHISAKLVTFGPTVNRYTVRLEVSFHVFPGVYVPAGSDGYEVLHPALLC